MKKYKIAVAGTGYVGLSIATLLSQHHHETAVDIIPEKVEMINNRKSPIQDDYIEKYLAEKELNLTVKPILWHIMKEYSAYGINEFIICAGYKQHVIKEWFADYFIHTSDITFDFTKGNEMIIHNKHAEPWKVTVVDTGLNTQTGGRIKRVKDFVGDDTFMVTYGDAVGDINIDELLAFHRAHGKIGTMSMYNFGQTKGIVDVGNNGIINAFREKSDFDGDLINIGYMVFEPALFDYIEGDSTIFEKKPLTKLVEDEQLAGYIHKGFWQCMDTLREKQKLEKLWEDGNAPWKLWKD